MLLHAEGIVVNQGVSIMIMIPTQTIVQLVSGNLRQSFPLLTLTHINVCAICLSSLYLQTDSFNPLLVASKKGRTEVVALLLQAKGIDVNHGVSTDTFRRIPFSSYHN